MTEAQAWLTVAKFFDLPYEKRKEAFDGVPSLGLCAAYVDAVRRPFGSALNLSPYLRLLDPLDGQTFWWPRDEDGDRERVLAACLLAAVAADELAGRPCV